MKKLTVVFLAALVCPLISAAQNQKQDQKSVASDSSSKTVTLSGTVSEDGMSLAIGRKDVWLIGNADTLEGREGQLVTVKCRVYAEDRRIQVLSIKKARAEAEYAANQQDSAFRR